MTLSEAPARAALPSVRVPSRLPGWPALAVVSLAATVLSWRPSPWAKVAPGLDPSWQAGLAVAFLRQLQWGREVLFTFGPYGLVDTILPFYRLSLLLAVLFALGASWGLAALVVGSLRPAWGVLPAGVAAWLVLAIANSHTGYADLASATALGLALLALRAERQGRRHAALALLGGLAGFALLIKFNDGLVACGLLAVALAAEAAAYGTRVALRAAAGGCGALAAVFLLAWAGAGQSMANLPSFFSGSWSVAAGYSSAMSLSEGRRAEDFFAVAVLVLLGLVFFLSARPVRARLAERAGLVFEAALTVSLAGWAWAALKEGFVRHDTHDLTFFGLALAAVALVPVCRRWLPVQAGAVVVVATLACVAAGAPPGQLHSPGASASALSVDLRTALGLGGFGQARRDLRAQLLAAGNGLPARVLSLVEGHSVAIEPADAAVAYVYPQLDWDPEPVLQGYSAYTGYLDGLGSKFLASSRAPARILYDPAQVVAGRDPWMGPPGTLFSMYCRYAQLAVVGQWQVLGRVADRCQVPRSIGTARVRFGEEVSVPRESGELVEATFSFSVPLVSKVEGVLLKPPALSLVVRPAAPGGPGSPETYRFVPGTAADPHVVATPESLGYSPAFTPPALSELELEGGGWAGGHGRVTVRFYSVRLAPVG